MASAHAVEGAPEVAADQEKGIRVSADGDDWNGSPLDLPSRLTPVKVRIVNHSGDPIQILDQELTLVGGQGRVSRTLPVVSVEHQIPLDGAGTIRPIYSASSFYVAPRLHDVYPSFVPWPHPLSRNEDSYQRQYQRWNKDLPTRAMQRLGLPEGVLAEGGEISGFLYFENATRKERRLVFRADIDDAHSGDGSADIELPFVVQ